MSDVVGDSQVVVARSLHHKHSTIMLLRNARINARHECSQSVSSGQTFQMRRTNEFTMCIDDP